MDGGIICKFTFRCERKWDDLKVIDGNDKARYCSVCENLKPYPWLELLSIQEQRAAITLYMIALNEKSSTLLSNSKNKSDELWALKVNACGTLFGAQINGRVFAAMNAWKSGQSSFGHTASLHGS